MTTDRLNRAISLLEAGEIVVSSRPTSNGSYSEAQAYGDSDFDMVVFEMEHVGFDFTGLRNSLQWLMNRRRIVNDGLGPSVVPFVRVPPNARETSQWIIKQALDSGVFGLVVPQLETPEEAIAIVEAARYPAQRGAHVEGGGSRGFGPFAAMRYWGVGMREYLSKANVWPLDPDGEILIIGMIETLKGIKNLERILDCTNGIGAIWPGPGDLSADMGLIGRPNDPEVEEQLMKVLEICTARGVPCAGVAASPEEAVRRAEQGFRIILTGLVPGVASLIRAAAASSTLGP
jgi:4-hydroxy-2-oxoheptanedioate aldolase